MPDPIPEPSVAPSAPGPVLGPPPAPTRTVPPPAIGAGPIPPPTHATRGQRIALLVGLVVVFLLALQLFASILLPFVVAAADRLRARSGRRTGWCASACRAAGAALLLIVAAIAAVLLFALLLYPLILSQIGLLIGRMPQYAQLSSRPGRAS